MLALTDLPAGATVYLTDVAWTGDGEGGGLHGSSAEGTVKFTAASDVLAGTAIVYVDGEGESKLGTFEEDGSFLLSASGDQLLIYSMNDDSSQSFSFGLQYRSSSWDEPEPDPSSTKGALPQSLQSGSYSVAVTHMDNKRWLGDDNKEAGFTKPQFLER